MSKASIFDLDATLVDSAGVAAASFADAHMACGLAGDPPSSEFVALSGIPLGEVCLILGLPSSFPEQFRAASRRRQSELKLFDGVLGLLGLLHSNAVLMGIITSKDRARTLETLRLLEIDPYFSSVVTPDDAPAPKPSPDGVLWICKAFHVDPSDAVVVGDSVLDMRAGLDAGAITVGCAWGVAGRDALEREEPHFVADSVAELTEHLLCICEIQGRAL